jgi:DNA-binding GntR family transcriptional regulator
VQDEHETIFRAIAAQDVAAARAAAEQHLRNAAARLRLYISDDARRRPDRRNGEG